MSWFYTGWFVIQALEAEGETIVIHTEAVKYRGVQVADVNGVLDDVVGIVVGDSVAHAGFYSAASDPCAEAATVVITSSSNLSLAVDCAPEFATPYDECIFQHAALFEIGDEGSGGLVRIAALVG